MFFGAALGLTVGIALGAGRIAYKAMTCKKDKNFDYNRLRKLSARGLKRGFALS
jgi:hypothetical protein